MKKLSVLVLGLVAFQMVGMAQNVKDQKVNFQYIQLPLQPLKGVSTYIVTVDQSGIEKINNDG